MQNSSALSSSEVKIQNILYAKSTEGEKQTTTTLTSKDIAYSSKVASSQNFQ